MKLTWEYCTNHNSQGCNSCVTIIVWNTMYS